MENNKNVEHVINGKAFGIWQIHIIHTLEASERAKQTYTHIYNSYSGIQYPWDVWRIDSNTRTANSTTTTGCLFASCFLCSSMCKNQSVITWWLWEIYLLRSFCSLFTIAFSFFFKFFFFIPFSPTIIFHHFYSYSMEFSFKLWNICFVNFVMRTVLFCSYNTCLFEFMVDIEIGNT